MSAIHGGDRIAAVLARYGVRELFTLCGGHISPILVGAKAIGIRVVDVRHEVDAVFAADAVARMTGRPGVAAVTAGPGVTNTITAVKNAQMAQSPVLVLGGATGTILKGRGSLQDIDQMALIEPHVKWATSVQRVRELGPRVDEALFRSLSGVPGPVFVECPVDLLYGEEKVRELYASMGGKSGKSLSARAMSWYLGRHVDGLFRDAGRKDSPPPPGSITAPAAPSRAVARAARYLENSERPVLLVGSQAVVDAPRVPAVVEAIEAIGLPTYLSGMARGLLGKGHPLQMRHQRGKALAEADLVLLAGVPNDFRLGYGRQVSRRAVMISANRSQADLNLNRRPTLGVVGDAGAFLCDLSKRVGGQPSGSDWLGWLGKLSARNLAREEQIAEQSEVPTDFVNPLRLCREIEAILPDDSVLVVDGGDFVATASYIVSPRRPLSWLDPGAFGTLGVGGGFALGARLCRPEAEVWILYGDGSVAYSLAEFDTFVRHGLPVIAVVGTDASWAQIAREQIEILGDDVGTVLRRTDYHTVAEGYGGKGFLVDDPSQVRDTLLEAQRVARDGRPVLINVMIGQTDFRKGSISM